MKIEDVCPQKFIDSVAQALESEKKITPPKEAEYIKTGVGKQYAPVQKNWYYTRTASLLRKLYIEELQNPTKAAKGFGTMWFARAYSTSKNNGHKPSHTVTGSKSLVRRILQSLESIQFVSRASEQGGRKLSSTGLKYLEAIAASH